MRLRSQIRRFETAQINLLPSDPQSSTSLQASHVCDATIPYRPGSICACLAYGGTARVSGGGEEEAGDVAAHREEGFPAPAFAHFRRLLEVGRAITTQKMRTGWG